MAGPDRGTDSLLRAFARSLRARNRSPKTISSYLEAARLLSEHACDRDLLVLTRRDIEEFLAHQLERHRSYRRSRLLLRCFSVPHGGLRR